MCVCVREQVSVWDVLSVLFCYSMLAAAYYSRVYFYPLFSCCCPVSCVRFVVSTHFGRLGRSFWPVTTYDYHLVWSLLTIRLRHKDERDIILARYDYELWWWWTMMNVKKWEQRLHATMQQWKRIFGFAMCVPYLVGTQYELASGRWCASIVTWEISEPTCTKDKLMQAFCDVKVFLLFH